jgi:hypothetical protein
LSFSLCRCFFGSFNGALIFFLCLASALAISTRASSRAFVLHWVWPPDPRLASSKALMLLLHAESSHKAAHSISTCRKEKRKARLTPKFIRFSVEVDESGG